MTETAEAATATGPAAARAAVPQDRTRYLTASGVALWGSQIGQVAVPLTAVTVLHAGAGGTSLLKTALTLPFVILGLPVGAWLDRVRRRPVMIGADLVRAAALTSVPVAAWFGCLTMTHLMAVVVVQGVATVFFDLATQSLVKDLAPGALLARTNARLATITQAAVIAGPPLAGWAAGLLSAPTVLLVMAAGYLWSAGWLSTLTTHEHPTGDAPRRRLLHEIGEGVAFVARQPVLRTVVIAGSMVNIGIAGVMTLLPVLALTELGWSEGTLGMFLGTGGLGGLIGAVTAVRLADKLGAGRAVLLVGIAVAPLAIAIPLLGRPVPGPLAATGWALVMLKVGFDSVLMTTFRQQVTPTGLMARVNGTMRVLFTGAVALGAATAGALATAVGIRWALAASAACLACVWIPIARSPLRRMTALRTAP
ncbi:MFS transporter [Streptomyces triculaminicus]|uniref:MFS transporter n=3 Tax=Streptomyces TaxID=1883 RepID=A0A939FN84_9ACTN|nr:MULTISPECIES: MFS transporter [Streptomyces]MBO0655145.1 MFS transporter [Streptomyces triculaminicus]QSY50989.1 MFS transporter [Streptomyces griseocarneus]